MARTLTAAIAELAVSLTWDDLQTNVVEIVEKAVADFVASGLAGSASETATLIVDWVREAGGRPDATLIGSPLRAPAALAALANGTTAHALDFDDYTVRMFHPSVCLLPPALALGETRQASGRDVILAYVAGFEVGARLGRAMNPAHYARGWHATATIGTLAAAVTAARMLGLDVEKTRHTLGVAASNACGLRQNFGSMVKPLHAGQAAFHGTLAAQLAARGFEADLDIMDGPRGFPSVFGGAPEAGIDPSLFQGPPIEIVEPGLSFKRFASCGAIHTASDAVLDLMDRHRFTADDVKRVRCAVNHAAPSILIHSTASTPLQGKFSLQYSLAVTLLDGDAGLAQYTDERVRDPRVQELSRRVEVVVDPSFPGEPAFPSEVTIELNDGQRFRERVDIPLGRPERPLSWDALSAKFHACAAGVLADGAADRVLSLAQRFAALDDVGVFAQALAGAGDQP